MEKTTKLVSLFAATVLVAGTLAGCGDSSEEVVLQEQELELGQGVCFDDDGNGYCDDDNDEVDRSYGFVYVGNHKQYYKKGYYPDQDGKVRRSGSTSTTKPTPPPPKSSSGTGTVVSGSTSGKSSSGSNTGISSGSKGGIGSSSSSSSS